MAFSINDIEFTVNGRQITNWSDDSDFLMFPEAKAHTKTRIGGGGRRLRVSDPARFGGAVTIKLLPGSDDVVYMQRLVEMSKNNMAPVIEASGQNRADGDSVQCLLGVIETAPDWYTFGVGDVKNMAYTFDFETIAGNWDGVSYD